MRLLKKQYAQAVSAYVRKHGYFNQTVEDVSVLRYKKIEAWLQHRWAKDNKPASNDPEVVKAWIQQRWAKQNNPSNMG